MKIYQFTQYAQLNTALVCYPTYFKIEDKTNPYYNNINYSLMYTQYNNYLNKLSEKNVNLYFLDGTEDLTAQVFTQDIGFIIEDMFFVSKLTSDCRQGELVKLKEFLHNNNIRYYEMQNNIEGGDVIHYGDTIFIGVSTRTSLEGIYELKEVLDDLGYTKDVVPIHFDKKKIHLDLVFNILDKGEAIMSPYVYDKDLLRRYFNKFYNITKDEADNFAANIVHIGKKQVLTSNIRIKELLTPAGYNVEVIPYDEISKGGGGLGCSILFLNIHD